MKRTIRLTETDLHNMISEAVKTALNELDKRTYASAMYRAQERNDPRAEKFGQAAADAWNRDYETSEDETFSNGVTSKRREKVKYDNKLTSGNFAYDTNITTKFPNGKEETYLNSYDTYPTLTSRDGASSLNKMRRLRDKNAVNSDYEKGKGWKN